MFEDEETETTRVLTAQQKKAREKIANKIGSFNQPKLCSITRKMISIGTVTRPSVTMTSRDEGPESLEGDIYDVVVCREVERREINIDPTLPGSPERIQWSVVLRENSTCH